MIILVSRRRAEYCYRYVCLSPQCKYSGVTRNSAVPGQISKSSPPSLPYFPFRSPACHPSLTLPTPLYPFVSCPSQPCPSSPPHPQPPCKYVCPSVCFHKLFTHLTEDIFRILLSLQSAYRVIVSCVLCWFASSIDSSSSISIIVRDISRTVAVVVNSSPLISAHLAVT